ncbi:MAG: di-heme oxidoredictase family protein [Chitinophagaceae bacterium]
MKKVYVLGIMIVSIAVFTMCNKASDFSADEYDPRLSGGMATVFDETSKAFTHAIAALDTRDARVHDIGDNAFGKTFVTAPAIVNSGLGPVFNNVSCISCHHNDGKGTPTAGQTTSSLLVRISIPGTDANGGPLAAPGFGLQLQDVAVFGKQPEVKINISYTENAFTYPDGNTASLRTPTYTLQNPYIALPANYMISPRMAPPVFGLGLLETISESTILANADENDANHDGISGKANYVWNPYVNRKELGRFGLKANTSSLLVQAASAYQQDMGITSYVFPQESSYGQVQADNLADDPELPDSVMNATHFYVRTLAVPARRNTTDATVQAGEKLFAQLNCSACHIPTMQTGVDVTMAAVSNQRIHAFTDLLLHDMGDALSDNRPDFLATGNEWRTAPLWGIGLFEKTNGTPFYLHDGRARSIEEAILWHGGEALQAKTKFTQLTKADRDALLTFLKSL